MRPPSPQGIDETDFDRHEEIFVSSYLWARHAIAALESKHNQAIAAILASAATKSLCQQERVQQITLLG
jgi:NTE family protein